MHIGHLCRKLEIATDAGIDALARHPIPSKGSGIGFDLVFGCDVPLFERDAVEGGEGQEGEATQNNNKKKDQRSDSGKKAINNRNMRRTTRITKILIWYLHIYIYIYIYLQNNTHQKL